MAVLLLSSWRTFENLLSDPEIYGFRVEDRKKGYGNSDIRVLHLTSAIARDVEDPSTGPDGSTAEDEHRVDSRAAKEKIGEKIT